ncbi:uncharacterized protein LOC116179663 [Photinus pyralis]|uniref:uncharacterized protein LOC116179663 n=1 Tax=Photinus pyralis TaxID=7054 RepID=UPI001266E65E|nr:uncharacterized protein LOC116179663 [Photinus pyralis]
MKQPSFITVLKLTVLHCIITVNVVNSYADYRQAPQRDDNEICKSTTLPLGLTCKSCSEIGRCVCESPGTNCKIHPIGTCSTGTFCDKGKCVTGTVCIPTEVPPFGCSSTGIFPDPYECESYHFCLPPKTVGEPLEHRAAKCNKDGEQSYGYNPITTFCSTKLVNNKCSAMPIPFCKKELDKGIVGNNPGLHYMCLKAVIDGKLTETLYPYQFACQFGTKFNVAAGECR